MYRVTVPSVPSDAAAPARRAGASAEWALIAAALVAAAALTGWNRVVAYRAVERQERSRLEAQARSIGDQLTRQFEGLRGALDGLREDLPALRREALPAQRLSRRLQALSRAMPGVQGLSVLDAQGRVLASSDPAAIGADRAARDDMRRARAAAATPAAVAPVLWLPAPSTAAPSEAAGLVLALTTPDGGFDGAVSAAFEAGHVRGLLRAALDVPDAAAALRHAGGRLLLAEPPAASEAGPGRIVVQHPVSPAGRVSADGLLVSVSRDADEALAGWRAQTAVYAVLYVVFACGVLGAMALIRRRQQALDRITAAGAAVQRDAAERIGLALRGADLGWWDLHLPSGRVQASRRWTSMLGLPDDPEAAGTAAWRARIHPDDWPAVEQAQHEHLAGRSERFEAVYRMRHADGHWVWILDRAQVLERDAAGGPVRMVGTHMDISERMQAQQALQRSEESLATTLDSISDAVIATDPQGRIVRVNAAAQRLTGWAQEEALGRPLAEVFRLRPCGSAPAADPVQQALAGGAPVGPCDDAVLVARDGHEHEIAHSAAPIRGAESDAAGITGAVLSFRDVTERRRVERALRDNEQRLRSLLDNIAAGVIVHAADTAIVDANPMACRFTGLSLDQMQGRVAIDPYWAFLEEDGTPMPHERFPVPQVLASGAPLRDFLLGVRRPDLPRPLWALCNAYPLRDAQGRIEQVVVTFADVTGLREAEAELRLLGASIARLNDVVIITEADPVELPGPRIVFVNEAFERLTGWRRDEAIGRTPRMLGGPQTDPDERARIGDALRRHEPVHAELLNYRKDGSTYWVELDVVPLRDARGRATHLVSIQRDITARREARQHLIDAQAELRATLEAVPDLLFEFGLDGTVHGFHSPRHDLLYVPPDEFLGRRVDEVLPAAAAEIVRAALQEADASGHSAGRQYPLVLAQGEHWFELSVARKPLPDGQPPRFIALARDVTERRRAEAERQALEQQLRESQKMESIGTLAGGIAHDFNNLLAAILGNVALAREDAAAGQPVQASLDQIHRAGLRARHLVQQILAFSRHEPQQMSVQPLRPVLEETLALLRATLPAGVQLDARLPEPAVHARIDATQLQQVLLNLCTNAWHALPERGGRIELGLAQVAPDEALCQQLPELSGGPKAHLWVRDNGSGMDAATRARIFDPFFTTKPVGRGTGLGLSVVHGIVRAHGGCIAVDTAPGQGSVFHVYLPAVVGDAVPETAPPAVLPAARASGQRVLCIDDDEVMVLMVERLLQRAGFEVVTERSPEAALARVRAQPDAFDVVLTDYNMPGASGIELARELRALRPQLPVVISSGHLSDELRSQAAAAGVRALLRKEHTLEELVGLLRGIVAPG